jgi:hypothetical protein
MHALSGNMTKEGLTKDLEAIAEVGIGGVLWLSPFRVDITDALVSGENKLEISITNQWTNRLIGDEQFPATDG